MKHAVGIDEVGRGALAGPVVVAAACVTGNKWKSKSKALGILKDSKKLSAEQRERWFDYFKNQPEISFAVARVYPRQIEERNISQAANLAAIRAFKKLEKSINTKSKFNIFLDGGLYLGNRKNQEQQFRMAKTLPKADENVSAVAIASIIAKVYRDRYMRKLSEDHPYYRFDANKGYGTEIHLAAIKRYGLSPVHRTTFCSQV